MNVAIAVAVAYFVIALIAVRFAQVVHRGDDD